ncbi:mandelate racemase/muconate lactonizing enzyme family protein [Candidatus Latescibacterota bacterium]
MLQQKTSASRRKFITKFTAATSAIAAGSLITHADLEEVSAQVNTNSKPSELAITDLRILIGGPAYANDQRVIVRIDTNQGISGYGDVRGRASETYALMLKSRILGMNPCNVAQIFYKIKQHGDHGVMGGGVSAVETALWDIAGKAWGVPVWQMLGGKFRDKVLLYADTTSSADPDKMAGLLQYRIDQGYKFVKMDLNIARLGGRDNVSGPASQGTSGGGTGRMGRQRPRDPHQFSGGHVTESGLRAIEEYCARVREIVGWQIPIATDHYGSYNVENIIKFAQAIDKYNFAWLEDTVPWQFADDLLRIKESCKTPILTGEDIYLREGFEELFEKRAISIVHPDPAEFGGILESKLLSDLASKHGIATAFHNHNNPTTLFASVHAAAAAEQFMVLEYHNADDSEEFLAPVEGIDGPIIDDGFVNVPDGPGLGYDFNEDVLKKWVKRGGYFEPTTDWDGEQSFDGQFL